jgi:hypothetical protein
MLAVCFHLTARDGHSVPRATLFPVAVITAQRALGTGGRRSSPPHVGWPPLSLLQTSLLKPSPTPLFPSHHSATLLAALLRGGHRFTSHHLAPPAPRTCPQRRLATPGNGIPPPSSSSVSTSSVVAFSDCFPNPPTLQQAPRRQRAPPRPLLRPPRPLARPLTSASSQSVRAPPQKRLPR